MTEFDPKKTIFQFSDKAVDTWTVDDAMKGISIIGGTGSGKTTASGKSLALSYLSAGWGGIVLCAKTDEAALWESYCEKAGRKNDVIMFGKGSVHKDIKNEFFGKEIVFNPIDYEMKRYGVGAGETQNLTNIFMNIYKMGNRISGGSSENRDERFWDTALKRCLNRVIELLKMAGEDLRYMNMVKVLSSCNNATEDFLTKCINKIQEGYTDFEVFKKQDYCVWCILKAYYNNFFLKTGISVQTMNAFNLIASYFSKDLPNLGEKTKGTVTESFMGLAEPFLAGILERHFAGVTNIFPECTFEKQKIIILNFPIKEYLDAGVVGQSIFKLMFQQAVERRDIKKFPVPVFLWCDEAHYFVNEYDQIFLTTARSSRTSTVFLSQNISNYYAVMGGREAEAKVDSLMGNLSTKIFHANSDARTNEYASRLIGMEPQHVVSAGISRPHFSLEKTETENIAMSYLSQVYPKEFTVLKSGGEMNNFKVQAIVMASGREWANGKNYIKITFTQKFEEIQPYGDETKYLDAPQTKHLGPPETRYLNNIN